MMGIELRSLTVRRLDAIIEALHLRLADEITSDIPVATYEDALLWAQQQREAKIARRNSKNGGK